MDSDWHPARPLAFYSLGDLLPKIKGARQAFSMPGFRCGKRAGPMEAILERLGKCREMLEAFPFHFCISPPRAPLDFPARPEGTGSIRFSVRVPPIYPPDFLFLAPGSPKLCHGSVCSVWHGVTDQRVEKGYRSYLTPTLILILPSLFPLRS